MDSLHIFAFYAIHVLPLGPLLSTRKISYWLQASSRKTVVMGIRDLIPMENCLFHTLSTGIATGIVHREADAFDEGAKMQFSYVIVLAPCGAVRDSAS